jgi:superkiller protein 3
MKPLEKLEESLRQEMDAHPGYPDLANLLGLLLTVEGRHQEALREYDKALGINPRYFECRINRAFVLAKLDRTEEALAEASSGVAEAPEACGIIVPAAKLFGWLGDLSHARKLLEKAAGLRPDSPAVHHYLGLTLLAGDAAQAASRFEKAASLGTAYIALYDSHHIYRKGRIKLTKKAAETLSEQLADNPNTVKAFLGAAKLVASEGLFDEAAVQFDEARKIEADSAAIENGLGIVAMAREYGEEAKLHFRRALMFDPANITALVNLSFQLGADGDLGEAEELLGRAVGLAPRYPDVRLQLATLLTEKGKLEEAESHLRQALEVNPKYVFAAFVLASILLIKKRYQDIIDLYSGFDIEALGLPEVYSQLASSYLETGQTQTGLEYALKASSMESPLPSAYVCLAIANYRLERFDEALATAREYIRRFPDGNEIEEIKRLCDILTRGTEA